MARALMLCLVLFLLPACLLGDTPEKTSTHDHPENVTDSSKRLLRAAILNTTTAPDFVLVWIVNDSTGERYQVCTEAPFLLGAIHEEFDLPFDWDNQRKAIDIALQNECLEFRLTLAEALDRVKPRYTPEVLADVRSKLAEMSPADLRTAFSDSDSEWHRLYREREGDDYWSYLHAVAHVLLENDILAGRGCFAPYLRVSTEPVAE